MKKAFIDVAKLDSLENVGIPKKACKLAEESGELMQVICRYVGMKSNQMTPTEMKEEAFGEVADVIQNCFCIANQFGLKLSDLSFVSYSELPSKKIDLDNLDYLAISGCKFFASVGKVMNIINKYNHNSISKEKAQDKLKKNLSVTIQKTLILASIFNIKFEDIEPKILEKDKKWLLRIDKKLKRTVKVSPDIDKKVLKKATKVIKKLEEEKKK